MEVLKDSGTQEPRSVVKISRQLGEDWYLASNSSRLEIKLKVCTKWRQLL